MIRFPKTFIYNLWRKYLLFIFVYNICFGITTCVCIWNPTPLSTDIVETNFRVGVNRCTFVTMEQIMKTCRALKNILIFIYLSIFSIEPSTKFKYKPKTSTLNGYTRKWILKLFCNTIRSYSPLPYLLLNDTNYILTIDR